MNSSADSHMDIAAEKESFRVRFRSYREGLSDVDYEHLSRLITDEVKLLPEMTSARTIHVYWPIPQKREVDTRPLIRWLEKNDRTVVLPRIVDFAENVDVDDRLAHVRYPGESELRVNRWGIFEPPPGDPVNPSALDAVIVPALGAGRNGHRIGHGFGYYDEFLSAVDCPKICLVYGACLVDVVPTEVHDVRLDVVVTEDHVIRVTGM